MNYLLLSCTFYVQELQDNDVHTNYITRTTNASWIALKLNSVLKKKIRMSYSSSKYCDVCAFIQMSKGACFCSHAIIMALNRSQGKAIDVSPLHQNK